MHRHCAPVRLRYHLRTGVSTELVVFCVPVTKWSESYIFWFHSYFSFVICISKLMMNCSPSNLDFDLRFGDYLLVKFQLSCFSEIGNYSSVRSVPVGQWGRMSGGELWTSSRVTHEHVLTRCCSINIQGVGLWYQTWTKMWINKLKACSV